ncbi:hypothetical protein C8Q77DRAFT_170556 [Trametes polyzona]|nr:hypothetical protein C8Q77DRAFT_170556 [Trametes polyzona]
MAQPGRTRYEALDRGRRYLSGLLHEDNSMHWKGREITEPPQETMAYLPWEQTPKDITRLRVRATRAPLEGRWGKNTCDGPRMACEWGICNFVHYVGDTMHRPTTLGIWSRRWGATAAAVDMHDGAIDVAELGTGVGWRAQAATSYNGALKMTTSTRTRTVGPSVDRKYINICQTETRVIVPIRKSNVPIRKSNKRRWSASSRTTGRTGETHDGTTYTSARAFARIFSAYEANHCMCHEHRGIHTIPEDSRQ